MHHLFAIIAVGFVLHSYFPTLFFFALSIVGVWFVWAIFEINSKRRR